MCIGYVVNVTDLEDHLTMLRHELGLVHCLRMGSVHPHPWRFVLVSVPTCGKTVPSRSFSWTPRSLDTTKWKMIKSVWKIARNMPWSFADTCDVFLNYVSSRLGADSSSQFSDSKINLDIQWYTFFNKFWWFPFKGSTDTCFSPPGRRKGIVIPQPAENHEAGWISLEASFQTSKMGGFRWRDDGGSIVCLGVPSGYD